MSVCMCLTKTVRALASVCVYECVCECPSLTHPPPPYTHTFADDYKDENPRGAGNRKDNYFKR